MESSGSSTKSSVDGNDFLLHKYQTIAAEYAKARAQVNVLKKAVIEEQSRSKDLDETVKQLKQSGRKMEQEMDSLIFRNQQLSCRVTFLQEELDEKNRSGKKTKSKPTSDQHLDNANNVLDEEFRKKIAENADLLSTIHTMEESHQSDIEKLNSEINSLKHLLENLQKVNIENEEKYQLLISKLEREKLSLRDGSKDLESVAEQYAQLQQSHDQYKTEMEKRLNQANSVISTHLPFVDSKSNKLNTLNVPRFVESKRSSLPEKLVQQVWFELGDAVSALADFYQHSEFRLHHLPHSVNLENSSVNSKYSSSLLECCDLTKELEKGLKEVSSNIFVEDSTDSKASINRIPNLLANYCTHIETFMPLFRLSLDEEDLFSSDRDLKILSQEILSKTSQFVSHIVQLNSIVTLASKQKNYQKSTICTYQRNENELIDILSSIHEDTKDMFSVYVPKFSKESEKSDLSDDLKHINSNVVSALSKLMDSTAKVLSSINSLWRSPQAMLKKNHPVASDLSKRAAHYFNCLESEESPSVPYHEALKDLEEARNGLELRHGLQKQLSLAQANVVRLEQECEHWKNEYQLVKSQISMVNHNEDARFDFLNREKLESMVGSLDCPFNLSLEIAEREETLKRLYMGKINLLISEKQEALSKAAAISAECCAITRRLKSCLENASKSDLIIQELREKIIHLQEELTTTSSSYENQLSAMSDHLAAINHQLTTQSNKIDELQDQISNKNLRKGKK